MNPVLLVIPLLLTTGVLAVPSGDEVLKKEKECKLLRGDQDEGDPLPDDYRNCKNTLDDLKWQYIRANFLGLSLYKIFPVQLSNGNVFTLSIPTERNWSHKPIKVPGYNRIDQLCKINKKCIDILSSAAMKGKSESYFYKSQYKECTRERDESVTKYIDDFNLNTILLKKMNRVPIMCSEGRVALPFPRLLETVTVPQPEKVSSLEVSADNVDIKTHLNVVSNKDVGIMKSDSQDSEESNKIPSNKASKTPEMESSDKSTLVPDKQDAGKHDLYMTKKNTDNISKEEFITTVSNIGNNKEKKEDDSKKQLVIQENEGANDVVQNEVIDKHNHINDEVSKDDLLTVPKNSRGKEISNKNPQQKGLDVPQPNKPTRAVENVISSENVQEKTKVKDLLPENLQNNVIDSQDQQILFEDISKKAIDKMVIGMAHDSSLNEDTLQHEDEQENVPSKENHAQDKMSELGDLKKDASKQDKWVLNKELPLNFKSQKHIANVFSDNHDETYHEDVILESSTQDDGKSHKDPNSKSDLQKYVLIKGKADISANKNEGPSSPDDLVLASNLLADEIISKQEECDVLLNQTGTVVLNEGGDKFPGTPSQEFFKCRDSLDELKRTYISNVLLGSSFYPKSFPVRLSNGRVLMVPSPTIPMSTQTEENTSQINRIDEICRINRTCTRFLDYMTEDVLYYKAKHTHCLKLLDDLKTKYISEFKFNSDLLSQLGGLPIICDEKIVYMPLLESAKKIDSFKGIEVNSDRNKVAVEGSLIKTTSYGKEKKVPFSHIKPEIDSSFLNSLPPKVRSGKELKEKINRFWDKTSTLALNNKSLKSDIAYEATKSIHNDNNKLESKIDITSTDTNVSPKVMNTIVEQPDIDGNAKYDDIKTIVSNFLNTERAAEGINNVQLAKFNTGHGPNSGNEEKNNNKLLSRPDQATSVENNIQESSSLDPIKTNLHETKAGSEINAYSSLNKNNDLDKHIGKKVEVIDYYMDVDKTNDGDVISSSAIKPSKGHDDDFILNENELKNKTTNRLHLSLQLDHPFLITATPSPDMLADEIVQVEEDCNDLIQLTEELVQSGKPESLQNFDQQYSQCMTLLNNLKIQYIERYNLDLEKYRTVFPITLTNGVEKLILLPRTEDFSETKDLSTARGLTGGYELFKRFFRDPFDSNADNDEDLQMHDSYIQSIQLDSPGFISNEKFLESFNQEAQAEASTLTKFTNMLLRGGVHQDRHDESS